MRIAFVYDALYPWVNGGAERRYHELASRLSGEHDVHMVSWQWWQGPSRLQHDGVTLHGVGRPPAMYGRDGKRTVREAVSFSARILPTLMRHRWDVIDCSATPYLPLYSTWLASRLTGTRLVATWHEFWGDHWDAYLPERPMVARTARRLESGARRLGDDVVAVSGFTARAMRMTEPNLRVVPNGVHFGGPAGAEPAADGAELVYLGRLIDEKRVDLLIDAVGLLAARFPTIRCAVIGDGPERASLRRQAEGLGLGDRVRFHGRVDDTAVQRHLQAARILVLPSAREGYGMVVAEAHAAGVVPVVTRAPFSAAPDLVRDGIDGLVVDPAPMAVADGIASLLADPARLDAMAVAGRAACAMRDWDRVATRMEQIYAGAASVEADATTRESLEWS